MTDEQITDDDARVAIRTDARVFRGIAIGFWAASLITASVGIAFNLDRPDWVIPTSFFAIVAMIPSIGVLRPRQYEIAIRGDLLTWRRSGERPMGVLNRSQIRCISLETGLDSDAALVTMSSGTTVELPKNLVRFVGPGNLAALVTRHWPEVDVTLGDKKWTGGDAA